MFGLKPWDADGDNPAALTWGEIRAYQQALVEHQQHMEALEDRRRTDVRR